MTRRLSIAVVLALGVAVTCGAHGPFARESGAAPPPDRDPGHDVIWSQLPPDEYMAWLCQFAPDVPFYTEAATDFVASKNTEITHIHWWGVRQESRTEPALCVGRMSGFASGRPELDCSTAEMRGCNIEFQDTNAGAPAVVDEYCDQWSETGPEVVYALQIPFPGTSITATLSEMTADLDIFLLYDCDESACLRAANFRISHTFADAGTYYLVVDGFEGAESGYTLTIDCVEVPPVYFTIRFYDDLAIGRGRSVPGTKLYEHHTIHFNEEYGTWPSGYSYWADIPRFPVTMGTRYWVSVQSVRHSESRSLWYWAQAESLIDNDGVMDAAAYDVERWTPMEDVAGSPGPTDFAFELADKETPVESRSWGVIKSLYR